ASVRLCKGSFTRLIHQRSGTVNENVGDARRAGKARNLPAAAVPALALAALLRPALPPVLPLPDLDVAVVLREGLGEDVGAVVAAHEVEIGDIGRRRGGGEAR